MSEPVSAFAAYKKSPKKEKRKGKSANKSPQKNKVKNVANKAASPKSKSNVKNVINPAEVDKLVEELLSDTTKKLTKAQLKKKKQLEQYLIQQVENYDQDAATDDEEEAEEEEYTDNADSTDTTGNSQSHSAEYSNEYTMNSSRSSSSQNNESAANDSDAKSDSDAETQQAEKSFSLKELRKLKAQSTAAQKRKNPSVAATNNEIKAPPTSNGAVTEPPKKAKKSAKAVVNATEATTEPISHSTPETTCQRNVKLEPLSPPANAVTMSSIHEGLKVFRWLLNPVGVEDFFAKFWEKNACLIQRDTSSYFSHLISFETIDQMLLHNHVEFTKNIDVTSYKNGIRETLNPEGRAFPPTVWDNYGDGCSIRLLNPQTFLPGLFTLCTTLQEYFHCLVGANAYLTPPNSQGFAPHYDDIEAFVLQIEGRKRWKLYKPRSQAEMLPRYSSPNFTQSEIGQPILEQVLKPGDVLYFPRGTIHQACTEPGYHSLHITLSVYQKQSFADLFERIMPLLLQRAITENVDMRRGLPLYTWDNAGIAFSDNDTQERSTLMDRVSKLLTKTLREVPLVDIVDSAVDQLAKRFQHEALPPEVLPSERLRTVFGSKSTTNERGEWVCDYEIELRTNVRPLRANIMRLVEEEQKVRIYYYLDNSKEFCEYEPNFIEIDPEEAGSVEVLIKSYPQYVSVSQLPLEDDEHKIQVVTALWERGLLMMEKPLK